MDEVVHHPKSVVGDVAQDPASALSGWREWANQDVPEGVSQAIHHEIVALGAVGLEPG